MLLSAVAVCGCAQPRPLAIEEIDDPSLLLIMNALEETIRAAREDRDTAWFSGHLGNAWVNLWGEPNYGLCYHWQELVYHGVLPTVREVGWEARGVQINIGTMNEHHAVLIIDPQRVALNQVLDAPGEQDLAYVLDAWRRGRADIYHLEDWLALPSAIRVPAQLEDLQE